MSVSSCETLYIEVSVVLFVLRREQLNFGEGSRYVLVFFGQVDSLAPRQQVQTLKCHSIKNEGISC